MRRNKFVNYPSNSPELGVDILPHNSNIIGNVKNNQIYYPALRFEKLKPEEIIKNKFITNNQNHKNQVQKYEKNVKSNILIKDNHKLTSKRSKNMSELELKSPQLQSRRFEKHNTIDLKNMPGAAYRMSGITIYRSKNIRSMNKFQRDHNSQIHKKSQYKKNYSFRNQQSSQTSLKKTNSIQNKKKESTDERCIKLYNTYIRSKNQFRNKNVSSITSFRIEEQNQEKTQDLLCRNIIQSQVYGQQFLDFQQQFF